MMTEALHRFCVSAVFCGAALRIAPEGTVRRILSVLVSAVLLGSIFSFFGGMQTGGVLDRFAGIQEYERRFSQNAEDQKQRMDRIVIEQELRTYILNKAEQRGITIRSMSIEMRWQTEGYWLPSSLRMTGSGDTRERAAFQRELEAELGIPEERQQWVEEDGLEENAEGFG